mmetsp:Transcript_37672/g.104023  ORF Transcript_37672/g.104023 Transcript_37672/m.104023 type:complete len:143 (-) Transcript_37672:11-439(-)|eukprot:7115013-Prymnesium_polylepis.1
MEPIKRASRGSGSCRIVAQSMGGDGPGRADGRGARLELLLAEHGSSCLSCLDGSSCLLQSTVWGAQEHVESIPTESIPRSKCGGGACRAVKRIALHVIVLLVLVLVLPMPLYTHGTWPCPPRARQPRSCPEPDDGTTLECAH